MAGRPTIWIIVGQGPIALAVGAGGWLFGHSLLYLFSPLSPFLWETSRYRLKCCLKGPLNPKQQTNQLYGIWINLFDKSFYSQTLDETNYNSTYNRYNRPML